MLYSMIRCGAHGLHDLGAHCFFEAKMSVVCGPHLQHSAAEVD